MITSRGKNTGTVKIQLGGRMIDRVDKFHYLGCILTDGSRAEEDIKTRTAACNSCLASLHRVIKSCSISRAAKVKIYNTLIRPVVLYGSKCWTVSQHWKNQLGVWERKVFRRIFSPIQEHGRQRIRMNVELEWCYKTTSIVTTIKTRRLDWEGHVQRTSNQRPVKKE
jgi:hypothetical protein